MRAGIRYLTGVSNPQVRAIAHEHQVGLLVTPDSGYEKQVSAFPCFAVDNGMFGLAKRHQEHKFDAEKFFAWVAQLPRTALFVAAPDMLNFMSFDGGKTEVPVGDAAATLAQFPVYAERLRALGFKVALVAQDGIEELLTYVRWDLIDAIFLGGSTEWKLGEGAKVIAAEATARGKHVHMGRVNSGRRLAYAQSIGCDTADGTFLAFAGRAGADAAIGRMVRWFKNLNNQQEGK